MATKPTTMPTWATDGGTTVEPTAGQKAAGFAVSTRPPARWVNWALNLIYQWIQYINDPVGTGNGPGFSATGGSNNGAGLRGKGGGGYGQGVYGEGGDTGGEGGRFVGKGTGSGAYFESESGPSAYLAGNATRGALHIVPRSNSPSNPEDGDFWIIGNTLFIRLNGATKSFTGT